MRYFSTSARWIGLIGNILEHYDSALFGLLAPFIASLFFERSNPLTALILTFGIFSVGVFFRPLGSLYFGWIGDRYGRKAALSASLSGVALVTVIMGCLPVYASVGIWAPLALMVCRMIQSFCAAGESVGAAIFILEHTEEKQKNLISSLYNASSIAGAILASALVGLCSMYCQDRPFWRWLFWSGGALGLVILPLRFKLAESGEFTRARQKTQDKPYSILMKNYKVLIAILCVAGFSYTTYALPFTFMNGYIPLVTCMTKTEAIHMNTLLLILDMCVLPLFGCLANRFSKEKMMLFFALFTCLSSIPLFFLLHSAGLLTIFAIRTLIVLCGVGFSATYYSWLQERVSAEQRYMVLSVGHAIGSQLIGAPSSAVCLLLYQKMQWTAAPALYLMVSSLLAGLAVYRLSFAKKPITAADNF